VKAWIWQHFSYIQNDGFGKPVTMFILVKCYAVHSKQTYLKYLIALKIKSYWCAFVQLIYLVPILILKCTVVYCTRCYKLEMCP